MRRRIPVQWPSGVLVLLGVLWLAGAVGAGEAYFLGEPWEDGIVRGTEEQRRAERRRVPATTLVARAERAARREGSVAKLYLLARAYGLRAQEARAGLEAEAEPSVRERTLAAARDDHASALATYRDVLAQAPRCYFAYHDMGVLELLRAKPDRRLAFDHFSRAYRINDRYTASQRQLINLYVAGRQYEVAIPLIQRLLELEPEDEQARAHLVLALLEARRPDDAYREVARLLRAKPTDPTYLTLQARVDAAAGRYDRAIATYKGLARANPGSPLPFAGVIECLQAMLKKKQPVSNEDYLFALKGLRRLTRDAKQRAELEEEIRKLEYAMARPAGGEAGGPPTTAQLLHALKHPDEQIRIQTLLFFMLREEQPTPEVLKAIAAHVSSATEPSGPVRGGAVRALGRLSGTALIPLLRHALRDPHAGVRAEAADTLVGIATRDARAAGPVIAILGPLRQAPELEVGVAVRSGILQLAGAALPGVTDETDDATQRRAFETWWEGAQGENVLIEALETYHRLRDRAADQVLAPYLASRSFYVFRAAYQALGRAAEHAGGEAFKRWYAARPRFPDDRLQRANWGALKADLDRWLASRPGA